MENKIKCFSKKHEENEAVIYCQNCRNYMCNKCKKLHCDLFENHILYILDKDISNIFTGICKEPNHNCELEYFCHTHNILCCSKCLGKLKKNGYGKHDDCKVDFIEDIKEEKKRNLNNNIINLEKLNININSQIDELKKIYEQVVEDKEKLKLKLQKIFTQLRNMINEEEDKILLEIDQIFKKLYFEEIFVKECVKLPKKINNTLVEGKTINKEWDEKNLNYLINGCINVEKNIETINQMNEAINVHKSNHTKVNFIEDEQKIKEFCNILKNIGKIITEKDSEPQNNINLNLSKSGPKRQPSKDFDLYPEKIENRYHSLNRMNSLETLKEENKICDKIIAYKKEREADYEEWEFRKEKIEDQINVITSYFENQFWNLETYKKTIKEQYAWESKLLKFVEMDSSLNDEQKKVIKERVNERKKILEKELTQNQL